MLGGLCAQKRDKPWFDDQCSRAFGRKPKAHLLWTRDRSRVLLWTRDRSRDRTIMCYSQMIIIYYTIYYDGIIFRQQDSEFRMSCKPLSELAPHSQ